MIFLIRNWKLIGLSALALAAIASAWWLHNTLVQKGRMIERAAWVEAQSKAMKDNAAIWKDVHHEVSKITDLDAAGAALGILRPDELR